METSRDDLSIAIRSAFLKKETQQKFSLFALIIISIVLIFAESINAKPINYLKSSIRDFIYHSSLVISYPAKTIKGIGNFASSHIQVYDSYKVLKKENEDLKNNLVKNDYLEVENAQLKKLVDEKLTTYENLITARVMIDKQSLYLNSFIINIGSNKNIKKGMAVLDGKKFIGRIVDVNFFSSRVLLVTDLNSKIPVIIEPSGHQAILSGHGNDPVTLDYLPKDQKIQDGDTVYTSGKEGLFKPGIPIGTVLKKSNQYYVSLFTDLNQVLFVNVNIGDN
jgi:rod shape-determining protein MreC